MNAEQVNAVGGWCGLVGVAFLVRDLMSLARYRERPREWAAEVKRWGARVSAWWRRVRGRPDQVIHTHAATGIGMTASSATASSGAATLTAPPTLSLQEQVEELRQRVNRLGEQLVREQREREQAITAERDARRQELRAEAEERKRGDAQLRNDVKKLRDATTGDLGLRAESVVFLTLGIIFTTWPELVAGWLPEWPPFRIAMTFLGGYLLLRVCWALWLRPTAARAG